jgi:hypothetical protein
LLNSPVVVFEITGYRHKIDYASECSRLVPGGAAAGFGL